MIALIYVTSSGERVTMSHAFGSTWAALEWATLQGAVVAIAKRVAV